jgi:hypothetical protein
VNGQFSAGTLHQGLFFRGVVLVLDFFELFENLAYLLVVGGKYLNGVPLGRVARGVRFMGHDLLL